MPQHQNINTFKDFLNQLQYLKVSVQNPIKLIQGNLNKNYLSILSLQGIRIPEPIFIPQYSKINLKAILLENNWTNAIIKSPISASANNTWVTTPVSAKADSARLNGLLKQSDLLVQSFIKEVSTEGEYSFIFFQ